MHAIERYLLALAMALLCIITMANVVVRYFTNFSFAFTEEISVTLLVFMTLAGAAGAFRNNNHIRVTLLVNRLPAAACRAAQVFALGASCVMFGVLAWYGARMTWDDYRYDVTSPALGLPQWIYTMWLPLLSLAIVLRLLQLMRARLRGTG
jgi:TRAP-type C4-dicarboxylate transport system permease small subunit